MAKSPINYWSSDPVYPIKDWIREVTEGNTRMGYWEWVRSEKEAERNTTYEQ